MRRAVVVLYGVLAYLLSMGVFVYAVGFVEDLAVPRSLDAGPAAAPLAAIAADALLLALFAVQHSVMARPGFKRWWTRAIPREIERSTYVLLASLALALVFWQWRPLPEVVWAVEARPVAAALRAASYLGWVVAFGSTFMISHLDLFGLRQVWLHARGAPRPAAGFTTRLLYRVVRHPIMLGFLLAFWATPAMTAGHLLFALLTTGYVLVGIRLEERDLVAEHGERYAAYRRDVAMLVPLPRRTARAGAATSPR